MNVTYNYTCMYTASRYHEEESTGIDGDAGFASKLCYSEQDTQHHILKEKHLVYAGRICEFVRSGYIHVHLLAIYRKSGNFRVMKLS